jgi:hypothetical protein
MKKTYMTPEMEVMNIETVEMIAASMLMSDDTTNTKEEGGQLAGDRRGTWGNLWN